MALCGWMAGVLSTLVDVQTTSRTGSKTSSTSASVADANFGGMAITVSSAAQLADSIDTNFSRQAVAVSIADLVAHSIGAPLAKSTAGIVTASQHACTSLAGGALRALGGRCANRNLSQAALLSMGVGFESVGTVAVDVVVNHFANSIQTTRSLKLTRILTFVVHAGMHFRTVLIAAAAK